VNNLVHRPDVSDSLERFEEPPGAGILAEPFAIARPEDAAQGLLAVQPGAQNVAQSARRVRATRDH